MNNPFERFFGESQNARITQLLTEQADIGVRCARVLESSGCRSLSEVVALEHEGDKTEEQIHEIIDSAFILRFDKSDLGNLASGLDNILDGMRQVAMHVDIYVGHIPRLSPEAVELLQIISRMTATVKKCVELLQEKRLPYRRFRELTRELSKSEAEADALLHKAEAALVGVYSNGNHDMLAFLAHDKLLRMLENITDVANYCGSMILSIARKET